MNLTDKLLAIAEHYANAVFVRAYILRELLRARRRGNKIDSQFVKEALTRPRWQEDFVLLLRFFDSHESVTLIDVGANDGVWTQKFLSIYPKASIIAIEPIPSNFARLSALHAQDARVLPLNVAAGDREGELELFVAEHDSGGVGASAHRYEGAVTDYSAKTTSHKVEMLTLDQILEQHADRIKGRIILKIDVQGHEAQVLKGAPSLLRRVEAAHIEVALFQYVGQEHGVTEIVPILSAAGLHLGPYQQCIGRVASRFPFELDMVFVRKESLPRLLGY